MISLPALRAILASTVALFSGETVSVHLFKNDLTPGPDVVPGDFTEADFTGYGADTVLFTGTTWDDDNQNAVLSFDSAHFQASGSIITNTIYGYWVETTATELPGVLIWERFDPPIAIASAADAIDVVPLLKIGLPVE